jgi:hypothetical protein
MYQRGEVFYADYYDLNGKRVRKSFPNEALALNHETFHRTKAANAKARRSKKASAAKPQSPTSSRPPLSTRKPKTNAAVQPKRSKSWPSKAHRSSLSLLLNRKSSVTTNTQTVVPPAAPGAGSVSDKVCNWLGRAVARHCANCSLPLSVRSHRGRAQLASSFRICGHVSGARSRLPPQHSGGQGGRAAHPAPCPPPRAAPAAQGSQPARYR